MSSLTISMIETVLMRSAPIGPGRDSKRIFGVAGLALAAGTARRLRRARRARAPRSARDPRAPRRRTAAARSSPACRRAAFEDRAGLLDQPARGALLVAAELRLDVHGFSPGQVRFALSRMSPDPHGGVERKRRALRDRFRPRANALRCGRQQVAEGAHTWREKQTNPTYWPMRRRSRRRSGKAAPPTPACHARMTRA